MFKKINISPAIFKLSGSQRYPRTLDEKIDDIIQLLGERELDEQKKQEIQQKLNAAIHASGSGKPYASEQLLPGNNGEWIENEMDIILTRRNTKKITLARRSGARHISTAFRIVISILMITLGFAMIILPTPSSFEIYTIYYFNANDGFTVMDLISLIIIFCGIYTLITVRNSSNK